MQDNHSETLAICDANVLIDYVDTDEDIIREVVVYWKEVIVPDRILNEITDLSLKRAKELGLSIVETPLSKISKFPGLSFQDSICLYHVGFNNAVCLSNDVSLRGECEKQNFKTVWGLEMLLYLAENKQITKKRGKDIAFKIAEINPEITPGILNNFILKINNI